jgi:hypothetical protein
VQVIADIPDHHADRSAALPLRWRSFTPLIFVALAIVDALQ